MSLRSKLLLLFVTLALAPLVAVGVSDYVQSVRLVTGLVDAHLSLAVERAARAVGAQYAGMESDLRLLAEEYGSNGASGLEADRWRELSERFSQLEVRSASGAVLATLRSEPAAPMACGREPVRFSAPLPGAGAGTVLVGAVRVEHVVADGALLAPVGVTGETVLVDRSSRRVIFAPRCEAGAHLSYTGVDGARIETSALEGAGGQFRFRDASGLRTASYVNLRDPEWTLVTSTAPGEFTGPEGRLRLFWLIAVLLLALAMAGGFAIMVNQIMRSLDEVTLAATRIGEGDFTPWLPPPGNDEVGRLTLAIGAMVARIREMMGQLERSRQMAVVGELASHLSHEIRNPLSSIRLNLQSIDREVKRGEVPADLPVVLQLCLREITRLDRVVNNVLRLGRTAMGPMRPCRMHVLLDESLEVVRPQLAQRGVRTERRYGAARDEIVADGEQLSGGLLNLYLNAADAMPEGGTLRVWTEQAHDRAGAEVIRVHVIDEGSGVSPELREQIFKPFYTTKPQGSGIGLPLSQQTVEAHGGRLYLEQRSELERGAEFVLEIPLAGRGDGSEDSANEQSRPRLTGTASTAAGVPQESVHAAAWHRTGVAAQTSIRDITR